MGSCMTTVKVLPNESTQIQTTRVRTEMIKRPSAVQQLKNLAQVVELRDKLLAVIATLEGLKAKLEVQGKALIKRHKRGRSLFALKRLRLYTNLIEDVQRQIEILEKAIVGHDQNAVDPQQLSSDSLVLLGEIKDIMKLESPLHDKETLKEREEKFKPLFKKYQIQNTDVYLLFAQYEAEVNEITLTTSTVFKKSDFDEKFKCDSDGLAKSESEALTKSGSDGSTQPNTIENLDLVYQGSEIKVC